MERFFSGVVEFFEDVIANPGPYVLIALWIVISWLLSRDEGKSFIGMLFKTFFFFLGLVAFHAVAPVIFWIVLGLSVVISAIMAIKGG
ncbi:MAG: hypothetical protein IKK43_01210 [Clostridia bacterium]|nr:hypothetical protein [Clostridia bacterium]